MSERNDSMNDVLGALRAATETRHAALDRALALSADAPTLDDYRDHLQALRAWLLPLEHWLTRFDNGPQCEDFLRNTGRIELIDADLSHPSMPQGGRYGVAQPLAPAMMSTTALASDAPAYRWGICYVIEGSHLGGAVLQRRLAHCLAPHPLRYLSGDNTAPGPRWATFITRLRAGVQGLAAIEQACNGACDAFDRMLALHCTELEHMK